MRLFCGYCSLFIFLSFYFQADTLFSCYSLCGFYLWFAGSLNRVQMIHGYSGEAVLRMQAMCVDISFGKEHKLCICSLYRSILMANLVCCQCTFRFSTYISFDFSFRRATDVVVYTFFCRSSNYLCLLFS